MLHFSGRHLALTRLKYTITSVGSDGSSIPMCSRTSCTSSDSDLPHSSLVHCFVLSLAPCSRLTQSAVLVCTKKSHFNMFVHRNMSTNCFLHDTLRDATLLNNLLDILWDEIAHSLLAAPQSCGTVMSTIYAHLFSEFCCRVKSLIIFTLSIMTRRSATRTSDRRSATRRAPEAPIGRHSRCIHLTTALKYCDKCVWKSATSHRRS